MGRSMSAAVRCLVIGQTRAGLAARAQMQVDAMSIRFSELRSFFPAPATLELVVAPLFSNDFDALELIDLVAEHGYRGTVRVVSPDLPNRAAVLRELRSHAVRRGITVEMVAED